MSDKELTFKEFIKKRSVIVLFVLMLMSFAFNACRYIRTGIYINEDIFLAKKSSEYYGADNFNVKVGKPRKGTMYKFTTINDSRNLTLYWDDGKAIATFENGKKISGYLTDGELVDSKGIPAYSKGEFDIAISTGTDDSFPVSEYEMALFASKAHKGQTQRYKSLLLLIFPWIVFVLGLLTVHFPNKMHFWGARWKYEEAELSEMGVLEEKIAGNLMVVASFVLMFFIDYII